MDGRRRLIVHEFGHNWTGEYKASVETRAYMESEYAALKSFLAEFELAKKMTARGAAHRRQHLQQHPEPLDSGFGMTG